MSSFGTIFPPAFVSFAKDIKLSHSVFALPFAASAVILGRIPLPNFATTLELVLAMVFARSFAMGANRWLDQRIDAKNPRTLSRAIPSGTISSRQMLFYTSLAGVLFVFTCSFLNLRALVCSIPLLIILACYSVLKRFTFLCHIYLGICLGLAPIAVSVALLGHVPIAVLLLGLAVSFWTAGFDCLYSLQDLEFDRNFGLHSIPQRFGPARTYDLAVLAFSAMVGLLVVIGLINKLSAIYGVGVFAVASLLAYELWIVRDARRIGRSENMHAAFFTSNACVSVIFFCFCLLEYGLS